LIGANHPIKTTSQWRARPTLVSHLPPGHSVGYSRSYKIGDATGEHIAVLPLGYAG
jgi:alanine racemase